jgi:hypothetical protein
MCELLVGLPAISVLGIDDERADAVAVHAELRIEAPPCAGCRRRAWVKVRPAVTLVDLACSGGRPDSCGTRIVVLPARGVSRGVVDR